MTERVIRQLGAIESIYDHETLNDTHLVSIAIRIEMSNHELLTASVLQQACAFWTKRYPLLSAKIARTNDEESKRTVTFDNYFVSMPAGCDLNNIEIIETSDANKWSTLVESELKTQLDMVNGPLWRLKVVKLLGETNTCVHFVFTCHHSITDGRNSCIFIRLFNIIVALLEQTTCEEMSEVTIESHSCVEELIQASVTAGHFTLPSTDSHQGLDLKSRVPTKTGNPGGVHAKFDCFTLSGERMRKLKQQLKKNTDGARLNGLLEAVFCLAYKEMLIRYGEVDLAALPFQFYTLISVRDKLKISNEKMGVYSVGLMTLLNDPHISLDSIWSTIDKLSKCLHARLKNNEDLSEIVAGYDVKKIGEGFNIDEYEFSHGVSNVGVVENTRDNSILKATEIYFAMPSKEKRFVGTFSSFISTIGDTLAWTFSYHEQTYTCQFIKEFIELIDQYLEKISNL